MKPLGIDLYCGLGGWTEGFLAEGFEMIGFDIERHIYGEHHYPAQLVLQDVRTLHGSQFKDAAIIVASSPCQKYSYMAMPWTRAKEQAKWYRDPLFPERLIELNELFEQPRRIQREASEAAGRHIPLVQENVRGAIPWVGRSQWHYGSYHLWGDVPALMPVPVKAVKVGGFSWSDFGKPGYVGQAFNHSAEQQTRSLDDGVKVGKTVNWSDYGKPGYTGPTFHHSATKNTGGSWFNIAHNTTGGHGQNPDGRKQPGISGMRANGKGDRWFQDGAASSGSKSKTRKAASARIAKIPFPLAQWIAHVTREAQERAA